MEKSQEKETVRKEPRTYEGNSQGRDSKTPETAGYPIAEESKWEEGGVPVGENPKTHLTEVDQ